ncbi:IclR family transcriptional regulator [Allostreptomyces psammosilenae]|uniref:Glycerol operon regulatory protein n=1 Tax=Allostreptomyces psammosilenae TaxID=1892865 RepID=A0A852ZQ90_9ACTN|nr:IclR family transcriptional regulator [Allostreptomyces psammosilenae]NYI03915.1 DNA-binding IclR family transcriptional regulator [Allostreptomyces psammosilenae]
MPAEPGTNQSVERAVAVLRAFGPDRPQLRVSDVAQIVGLGTSTTSRLLATLEQLDLVERDPVSALYRVGLGVLPLAAVAVNQHPVHRASRMVLQELAARTGLGANAAVRRDDQLMFLCNFEGPRAPKAYTQAGHTAPLHATGIGKCLLSGMSPGERRALLGAELPAHTQHTVTSHEALDAVLEEIRRAGYAVEEEERALGRASVAAPVVDSGGAVVAGVSLWGPASVLNEPRRRAELVREVIEAADAISQALGAH